jgi:hypothetical protein
VSPLFVDGDIEIGIAYLIGDSSYTFSIDFLGEKVM